MPDSAEPPCPAKPRRGLLPQLILLLAVFLLFRTWLVQGVLAPYGIASGSMAPALLGPHRRVTCGECGFGFDCGVDLATLPAMVTCPNCGCPDNPLGGLPTLSGDRLLIEKAAYTVLRPQRWQLVAFRQGDRAGDLLAKRIVGLPGESIHLEQGDVFADGHIVRKSFDQQRAMAVLVHDARYEPGGGDAESRWQPAGHSSAWGASAGRLAHPLGETGDPVQWIEFCHGRRTADGSVRAGPITDRYGYNAARSRRVEDIHPVTDLMLRLRVVQLAGRGLLLLRLDDGGDRFRVQLDVARGSYEVFENNQPVPAAAGSLPGALEGSLLEISSFDQQFGFAMNGWTLVLWPYTPSRQPRRPVARPLAIGLQGLGVSIRDVKVLRDVYYTRPVGFRARWAQGQPVVLADDEYFVLGDNSPVSEDSRTWPGGPAVRQWQIVGRPLLVHFPARRVSLGGYGFEVPDPGRVRLVR